MKSRNFSNIDCRMKNAFNLYQKFLLHKIVINIGYLHLKNICKYKCKKKTILHNTIIKRSIYDNIR